MYKKIDNFHIGTYIKKVYKAKEGLNARWRGGEVRYLRHSYFSTCVSASPSHSI